MWITHSSTLSKYFRYTLYMSEDNYDTCKVKLNAGKTTLKQHSVVSMSSEHNRTGSTLTTTYSSMPWGTDYERQSARSFHWTWYNISQKVCPTTLTASFQDFMSVMLTTHTTCPTSWTLDRQTDRQMTKKWDINTMDYFSGSCTSVNDCVYWIMR